MSQRGDDSPRGGHEVELKCMGASGSLQIVQTPASCAADRSDQEEAGATPQDTEICVEPSSALQGEIDGHSNSGSSVGAHVCAICLEDMDRDVVAAQRGSEGSPTNKALWNVFRGWTIFSTRGQNVLDADQIQEEAPASVVVTACGHAFHQSCFDLSQRAALVTRGERSCPVCRGTLRTALAANPSAVNWIVDNSLKVREFVEVLWYAEWCNSMTRLYFVGMISLLIFVFCMHVGTAVQHLLHEEEEQVREVAMDASSQWNSGGWWDAGVYSQLPTGTRPGH